MKFIVVGGIPFRTYTGTVTYTGLKELGQLKTKEEANKCIEDNFDESGGLILLTEVKD